MTIVVLLLIAVCTAAVLTCALEAWESDDPIARLCDDVLATHDHSPDLRQHVRAMPLTVIAPVLGLAERRASEAAAIGEMEVEGA